MVAMRVGLWVDSMVAASADRWADRMDVGRAVTRAAKSVAGKVS